HLVVVAMSASGEEHDRDAVARVLVVIAPAVVLLRMTVGVVLVVELEGRRLRLSHRLHEITELRGQATRADELQIARATALYVARSAAPHHVDVQLGDD